jgi:hypothetical protein
MFCQGPNSTCHTQTPVFGQDRVTPLIVSGIRQAYLGYQKTMQNLGTLSTRQFCAQTAEFVCKLLPYYSPEPFLHEALQATNG